MVRPASCDFFPSVGIRTKPYMAVCFSCLSPNTSFIIYVIQDKMWLCFLFSCFCSWPAGAYLSYYVDTRRQPTGWLAQRSLRWRTPKGLLDREPDSASGVPRTNCWSPAATAEHPVAMPWSKTGTAGYVLGVLIPGSLAKLC